MPRRRSNPELDGIPLTAPGAGLRVSRKRRKTRVMGLLALGDAPPRVVEEVEHRAFVEMPSICGKCRSLNLVWQREVGTEGRPRRVFCVVCGWDTFFVMASQAPIPVLTVPVERGRLQPRVEQVRATDVARWTDAAAVAAAIEEMVAASLRDVPARPTEPAGLPLSGSPIRS